MVSVTPRLERPFKVIAFDWDGTAVANRREDAGPVRALLERLLELGVYVVVITGTNFQNVDRQLSAAIHGPCKRNLYVCTNRGSEVYGFDAESRPVRIANRQATPKENRLLTEIADAVRDAVVARTGLDVRVVYNRLNRRKIDLIPLPEWADPPKSAIGDLLRAVQSRLRGAGLGGGLGEVFRLAEQYAREKGLPAARITSDVKHVEVGLTDKSDSIDWVMRELVPSKGIAPGEVLIGGDEFGPVAGFDGSDYKMVAPSAQGAVFVSVGREPNGVPPGVIHLGGGPACFRELLARQVAVHERLGQRGGADPIDLPATPTNDPGWVLVEEGFNLAREHEVESLFALANGYLGTRGAVAEGTSFSRPATFVAGVFARPPGEDSVPELAVAPEWEQLRVVVHGDVLSLEEGKSLEHRRLLDMRQGLLFRDWRHRDPDGRVTAARYLRLASLADRHVLLQSVTITPENYSGYVVLQSVAALPAPVQGSPARTPSAPSATPDSAPATGTAILELQAEGSGVAVALAFGGKTLSDGGEPLSQKVETTGGRAIERCRWDAEIDETCRLDRLVTVYTSLDAERPAEVANGHLQRLLGEGVERLVAAHVAAWGARWRTADTRVEGDEDAQRALRFAIFHLIAAADPEHERASIGARSLTGESYKGHVFWDTEIYMLPFFTFTYPPSARALLVYRYHTLPAARRKASAFGYRGALYAWESADTGEETAPPYVVAPDGQVIVVLAGEQEHHISADIAYAVWQYWQASGDDAFLIEAGAEIVVETARFWASRGRMEEDGRYHIRKVIGPDEYHEGVDDNAYTNVMAQWNLERAAEAARLLAEKWPASWRSLAHRLGIGPDEPQEWLRLADAMYTGFDPATGLFEQFRGYFDLEEIDLSAYKERSVPMDVLLGRERIARSKVVKQADVLMLIYLLWDRFPQSVREANFRYYEPRTGHGSSLSPSIHALLAARLGEVALAEHYFRQAAEIDLANNMGNAAGGVHAAALGGLWQATVCGFAGMRLREDGLTLGPHLPQAWRGLGFPVQWRGRTAQVSIESEQRIEVTVAGEAPMTVALVDGPALVASPGRRYEIGRENGQWRHWREVPA